MKTFMTTAAIVAALTFPALAEADDPSAKQGEATGNLKASTTVNSPPAGVQAGGSAMGQGQMRATTGASSQANDPLVKETQGSIHNPGAKTGVSGGADGGSSSGNDGGSSGGSGSGGGSR